ncbi:MAG: tRNA (N6-isopentenyl adenosine(37)-C2)-methylthiotransferase MiaB [bacterium]|nr:tRNA (N6-isopentenyl adenosine(37)-C2)-methylthiotransferase MiaB [bacterium]
MPSFIFHTYGCQMNVRESEAAAKALLDAGFTAAPDEASADIIIVNSCSVRQKAEDKALGKLGLLCATKRERPNRVVGLMGCMAQRLGKEVFKHIPTLDFSIGTRCADRVAPAVMAAIHGEHTLAMSDLHAQPDAPTGHVTEGAFSAFVTILLGCNRRCTYCIVPDVRGDEWSRPARDILKEIEGLAAAGIQEVTLLGQSIMNYGLRTPAFDENDPPSPGGYTIPFPRLLEAVAAIPGIKRIRFTSGHPSGVTDELIRLYKEEPKLCHHLHLPVQSGSTTVLSRMRRGYTRTQYLEALARLRQAAPDIAITTDVIVGFPGETEADFEETRTLMEAAQFDNAFIFKYSPRPGTVSATWEDDVSEEEKSRRNHVLLDDQDARGRALNASLLGSTQTVLAEGPSLRNASRWSGRTSTNQIVIFKPYEGHQVGDSVTVKIGRVAPQTLYAEDCID